MSLIQTLNSLFELSEKGIDAKEAAELVRDILAEDFQTTSNFAE
jgi:hypothetical protein